MKHIAFFVAAILFSVGNTLFSAWLAGFFNGEFVDRYEAAVAERDSVLGELSYLVPDSVLYVNAAGGFFFAYVAISVLAILLVAAFVLSQKETSQ